MITSLIMLWVLFFHLYYTIKYLYCELTVYTNCSVCFYVFAIKFAYIRRLLPAEIKVSVNFFKRYLFSMGNLL
jgi:hypothetical protein